MGDNVELLDELLALALSTAQAASSLLANRPTTFEINRKSNDMDFATQMDHKSEELIVSKILSARPDDGIIGEEGASRESKSGITWVIDPLDGTVNYFYGLPGWNVSIAAKDRNGTLVGVVSAPSINSLWRACVGGGAFFNEAAIACNEPIDRTRALIGTGFAYEIGPRIEQLKIVGELLPNIRDIRRNGAAAVDLCHVAMGALDAYIESGLKEWDLAAGALIAAEAGALVETKEWRESALTIAAGPSLYAQLASIYA